MKRVLNISDRVVGLTFDKNIKPNESIILNDSEITSVVNSKLIQLSKLNQIRVYDFIQTPEIEPEIVIEEKPVQSVKKTTRKTIKK